MKRVPHAREVDQAIRSVRAEVKQALKGVNAAAAQVMAKGDYASAEALVAKGREIQDFHSQVDKLHSRWREVRGTGSGSGNESKDKTPLWSYYQPILMALVELGGEARRQEFESEVERIMTPALKPGDRDVMARGQLRWQVMIRRARKQLVTEAWIEKGGGPVWTVTEAGRAAAKKPLTPSNKGAA